MNCELAVEVAPYSSATVGMRTARPTDALSTVSGAHWYDSAALGEKNDSRRSGQNVLTAGTAPGICVTPLLAVHHSARPPSTVFHLGANAQASCAYRLCSRVLPPTLLATLPAGPAIQSATLDVRY